METDSNLVIFTSTKELIDDDVEVVSLYLENPRRSGGGEIDKLELNDNKRTLNVYFKNQEIKEQMNKQKVLKFNLMGKNYELKVTQPFKNTKLDNVLCLKNLHDKVSAQDVELYGEYLVPNTQITKVNASKIFPNTFFVEFEKSIAIEMIQERSKKYSKLFSRNLEFAECYQTNSIIGKYEDGSKLSKDILELHFTNPKRSGCSAFIHFEEIGNDCFIIRFENEDMANVVTSREQKIQNKILFVERLFILPEQLF